MTKRNILIVVITVIVIGLIAGLIYLLVNKPLDINAHQTLFTKAELEQAYLQGETDVINDCKNADALLLYYRDTLEPLQKNNVDYEAIYNSKTTQQNYLNNTFNTLTKDFEQIQQEVDITLANELLVLQTRYKQLQEDYKLLPDQLEYYERLLMAYKEYFESQEVGA